MNEVLESILNRCFLHCSVNSGLIINKLNELTTFEYKFDNYKQDKDYLIIRPTKNEEMLNSVIKFTLNNNCINNIEVLEVA